MKAYRILPHTSEVGLEIRGRDPVSLFTNAAQGLLEVCGKEGKIRTTDTVTVRVRSSSPETLLVHWLSELLYLIQTRRWLFAKIEFARLHETNLTATLHGEPMKDGVHRLGREVKAVTFHDLSIVRDQDALKANVIFDV